jgi:hypothetical protein
MKLLLSSCILSNKVLGEVGLRRSVEELTAALRSFKLPEKMITVGKFMITIKEVGLSV